jgi:nucleoside-diphosphate-sugar epimerase|tara:strand:+ start:601 stop:1434 length:834 start_codon:yes stop_codon:yes gene_type:complete
MSSSSVLVTGCNGYAGSKISELLLNNYNLVGIDIVPGNNESELIDLRDYESIIKLENYGFDYVIHTAWDQTSKNIYNNNVEASRNLIEYLNTREIKGIIFISSYYVSTTVDIQYARSKLEVENMIFDSGIPFVIIRPDMLYSLDEKKIQEQLSYMKKRFAICVGNGKSLRTPTQINDLVELIDRIITDREFTNKVYEIGSPISYSQVDILRIIAQNADLKPIIIKLPVLLAKILFNLTGKVDPEQAKTIKYDRVVDLNNLKKDFGFTPIDFENGLMI